MVSRFGDEHRVPATTCTERHARHARAPRTIHAFGPPALSSMLSRFPLAMVLSLVVAAPVAAQSADTLAVPAGTELHIATRSRRGSVSGTLRHQTSDGFVLSRDCRSCAADSIISWSDLQTVDARIGRTHSAKSALVGAGLGLAAGTVIGALVTRRDVASCERQPQHEMCGLAVLMVPVGSLIGLVNGLITGVSIGTERWVPIWPSTTPVTQRASSHPAR
jgi:hypothetical protein